MMRLPRRPLSSTFSLLLLAGMFLSACSGGCDGGGATTSAPPVSTPPSSKPPSSTPPPTTTPPPTVGQLIQQGYLKASNTGAEDNFGFNLALDGDTLVVGAPFEDSNATGVNGDQTNNIAQ